MESFSNLSIIIPTFYPGTIINNCLDTLPKSADIIIVDNGNDIELEKIIKNKDFKIRHFKIGDVGLPKSFNYGLKKSKNENILITQPDVSFYDKTISNLIEASKKYSNIGLLAPLIYENKKYSQFDCMELKLNKLEEIQNHKKIKNFNFEPSGDFCVEAVNATAMLLKKSILEKIGGWDENIYTYLEDIDLCLRLRKNNFNILKVYNAKVDHVGFGSHKKENSVKADVSRNWHFCWSSLYFRDKYFSKNEFTIYFVKNFLKYSFKILINFFLLRKKKLLRNFYRLKACINYLTIKKSNFRV